jgi:hypothetical protein
MSTQAGVPTVVSGPAPLDWTVYAGDRNLAHFTFNAASSPWDITGASIAAQARLTATAVDVALTAAITIDDPEGGLVSVAWDGEQVRTLLGDADRWRGVWDLQILEFGMTLPVTLLRGKFTALLDVTRSVG